MCGGCGVWGGGGMHVCGGGGGWGLWRGGGGGWGVRGEQEKSKLCNWNLIKLDHPQTNSEQ